jgi:uncharacterized protein YfaQ (DUF2300 family)
MHAAAFPLALSRTTVAGSLVALLAGAALAGGVTALADSDGLADSPTKVIVVEAPSQGTAAKDEAAVASAIAIGPELRGSKASAIKTSGDR